MRLVFIDIQFDSSYVCTYHFKFFIFITDLDCGMKPEENKNRSLINHKGRTVAEQIVGGNPADPGEWSWQVLLQWENEAAIYKKMTNKLFCGGAILSQYFILTAAHCYIDGKFNYSPITFCHELTMISSIL